MLNKFKKKKNYKIDIHMTKFSSSHLRELALLAQWVEHFVRNEKVTSSNLVESIKKLKVELKGMNKICYILFKTLA